MESAHLYFIVTFYNISVEPLGPTGKIWCPFASLEPKVAKIALVGARIHLQNGQRDVFTSGLNLFATQALGVPTIVKSPLTSGFFQKIASTDHTNLMMIARGLLKRGKMAREDTYTNGTYQVCRDSC